MIGPDPIYHCPVPAVPKRTYDSTNRSREARETHEQILDAALALFGRSGYAHVTVAEIATRARVSLRTVYGSVGGKAQILAAVIARADAQSGGSETIARARRLSSGTDVLDELAQGTGEANRRNQPIFELVRATSSETGSMGDWRRLTAGYRALLQEAADHLHALGQLAPDTSAEDAGDILWFCFGIDAWTTTTRDFELSWPDAQAWLRRRASDLLQISRS